ncbi:MULTISPECIES: hypothetical protein [Paraburkholderia]|uniref:Uncharacterized protein n=1 Tax=Paraburkholderia podalyriae TaxID=1938811 RepID=A0ABR7PYR1_9BURK|nr:hypothetical protein [Paraburkholderia podalyriae]MBC8751424.1 hypothetical protein [Paraburkholderia podalyriae]
MKLESVSRIETLKSIEKEFGYGGEEAVTRLAALSEHIRAAVLLESQRDGGEQITPVATATITRTVRQRLSPLWTEFAGDDQTSDPVLEGLGHLAMLGELMKVDSSHWIPAPSRTISVDHDTRVLIAASPLAALPLRLRKAIQVAGRARLIDIKSAPSESTLPLQRLTDWMRCPHDQVGVWSQAFIEHYAKKMSAVEGVEGAELFLHGTWQQLNALKQQPVGTQLYRRKVFIYGSPTSEYGLCRLRETVDSRAEVAAALVIDKQDARRIQGAMQSPSGSSQPMKLQRNVSTATLVLPRPLPAPENAFLSLGWKLADQKPSDWPKRYAFSARLVPLLKSAVELIGYQLIEQPSGE